MTNEYRVTGLTNTSLIVFIRFPRLGKVKSRLAQSLGLEIATQVYRLCADKTLKVISDVPGGVRKYVFYSDKSDENEIKRWIGKQFRFLPQLQNGLGKRIEHAFLKTFGVGARKAIILASDVPDLTVSIIDDAIRTLDHYNIVIGPCYDGGYYLLGMSKLHKGLFRGVSWGTEKVYHQTLCNAESLGLTSYSLPFLIDIDSEEDLRKWAKNVTDNLHPVLKYLRAVGFQIDRDRSEL